MKPVGRGHPLRVLEEVGGLPAARLSKTHRFRNRDHAAAVAEMAHSRPEKGFDALDRLGYIREIERDDYGPVAAEYARAIKEGKSALIACPTHSEGRKIATAVRERLRAEGLIGKEEQVLPRLVPTQWTEAERADSENYESGMVAHFFRARGRTRAGEKVPVIAENASELASAAAKHQVYRRDVLPVAAGDKLRVTRNGKTRDGEHAVNNGEIVTVRGFTAEGDVIDERGWVIGRNFEHLAHGYVVTAIPSQGKTVDRPIGVATQESYPAVRDDWQYVTASRGREPILLFTDDKRRLRQLVARADKRLSAVELLGQSKRRSLAARARARIARMRRRGMLAMRLAARSVAAGLAAREWRHEARSAYR
jgi:ATP-dependent exoDNAse (exonuclease V) alpha subunit